MRMKGVCYVVLAEHSSLGVSCCGAYLWIPTGKMLENWMANTHLVECMANGLNLLAGLALSLGIESDEQLNI